MTDNRTWETNPFSFWCRWSIGSEQQRSLYRGGADEVLGGDFLSDRAMLVTAIANDASLTLIEDTDWSDDGEGTPQGSVVSPLLANV